MRRWLRRLVLAALVALAAAVAAAGWAWSILERPYGGAAPIAVDVAPGTSARQILAELERRGVLRSALVARLYLVHRLGDPPLQAGEYRFSGPLTVPQVLARLVEGDVVTYPVTIPEGLTAAETAAHLAAHGFGEEPALAAAMADPRPIADLDPQANDLEGYLFPDTYRFPRATPPERIVGALVANFRRRWQQEVAPRVPAGGPGLREVVILASIVEKEARRADERPLIAGVYANRLRRGIALYADPTVIYGLKREGRWNGNLTRAHLEEDSPYNTYRRPGLPPGPIASPGAASLAAAAAPADVPYLYFVSRNDGSHVFAESLAEHNRNVREWQVRYWQQRRRGS